MKPAAIRVYTPQLRVIPAVTCWQADSTVVNFDERLAAVYKRLDSVKHLFWHGNTVEALERLTDRITDLSLIQAHSGPAKKPTASASFKLTLTTIANSYRILASGEKRSPHPL